VIRRAAIGIVFGLVGGCDPVGLGRPNPDFLVIGHHGSPNHSPENTLPSYEVAVALGANALEPDICRTRDGVFVAFHDCDPDSEIAIARQEGGEGYTFIPRVPRMGDPFRRPVRELTLEELRAHYGYQTQGGEPHTSAVIPTLDEVLVFARGELRARVFYWDLKFLGSEVAEATAFLDALHDAYLADTTLHHMQSILLNVHRGVVVALEARRIELAEDHVRVAWDFERPGALAGTLDLGLRDVSVGLTPSFTYSGYKREVAALVQARERGEVDTVMVWTLDRPMQIAEMLYYSVDGLITNDCDLAFRMWQDSLE
jgi:glycerophosphoryl diester phosphodiesterase